MKINCGVCKIPLKDEDMTIMDGMNGLSHRLCYEQDPDFIQDVDLFKNLKEKYWFFQSDKISH